MPFSCPQVCYAAGPPPPPPPRRRRPRLTPQQPHTSPFVGVSRQSAEGRGEGGGGLGVNIGISYLLFFKICGLIQTAPHSGNQP